MFLSVFLGAVVGLLGLVPFIYVINKAGYVLIKSANKSILFPFFLTIICSFAVLLLGFLLIKTFCANYILVSVFACAECGLFVVGIAVLGFRNYLHENKAEKNKAEKRRDA